LQIDHLSRCCTTIRLKFDLHIDAVIADRLFAANLTRKRYGGDYVANEGAFFTFAIQNNGGFVLKIVYLLLYFRTSKTSLHLVPQ
jgi:hypothetical protein